MIIGIIVLVLGFVVMMATGVPLFGATAIVFVGWGALILIVKICGGIRNLAATPEPPQESAHRNDQLDGQKVSRESTSRTPIKNEPVYKAAPLGKLALWTLIAASLLWCTVVFSQYRGGPYVTTGKALVDCIPFILLIGGAVCLFQLTTSVNIVAMSDAQSQGIQRSSNMASKQHSNEMQPSTPTSAHRARPKRARLVGIIVGGYLALWFLTAIIGGTQVRAKNNPSDFKLKGYFWQVTTRSPMPFIVGLRVSGQSRDRGNYYRKEYYLWLGVTTVSIADHVQNDMFTWIWKL